MGILKTLRRKAKGNKPRPSVGETKAMIKDVQNLRASMSGAQVPDWKTQESVNRAASRLGINSGASFSRPRKHGGFR
jgi:hypothetical protein